MGSEVAAHRVLDLGAVAEQHSGERAEQRPALIKRGERIVQERLPLAGNDLLELGDRGGILAGGGLDTTPAGSPLGNCLEGTVPQPPAGVAEETVDRVAVGVGEDQAGVFVGESGEDARGQLRVAHIRAAVDEWLDCRGQSL